ncbi:MAG: radical SAM protein [Brevinematia bacterium]
MNTSASYLKLPKDVLKERIEEAFSILDECKLCPRKCGVNRNKNERGYCKAGFLPVVSSYGPHFGEESVLVGKYGSGTIFFTGCNLGCIYCQNYEISQLMEGREVSFEELARMMIYLQHIGCHNINFVTPTHQVPQILKALEIAIELGLKVPLVYNTGGYDCVETLKLLEGIFDIYMPDIKYSDNSFAQKYSNAKDYFDVVKQAVKEMHRQVGDLAIDQNHIAYRGLLVRHLVLPNNIAGSYEVFKFLLEEISPNTFINIMAQYRPCFKAHNFTELSRRIYREEFLEAVRLAVEMGFRRIIS